MLYCCKPIFLLGLSNAECCLCKLVRTISRSDQNGLAQQWAGCMPSESYISSDISVLIGIHADTQAESQVMIYPLPCDSISRSLSWGTSSGELMIF